MKEQLFVVTSDEFVFPMHTVFIAEYEEDYDNFHVIDCRGNSTPVEYLDMGNFCKVQDYMTASPAVANIVQYQVNQFRRAFESSPEESNDVVRKPNHYQLFPEHNLEVKDINKRLLDRIEESDFDMTLYEAGFLQQSLQYFLRFYAKNGVEDIEKGIETMQFVLDSMKNR